LRSRNPILGRPGALVLMVLLLAIPASLTAKTHPKHASTPASKSSSPKHISSKKSGGTHGKRSRHSRNWRHRGQQQVDVHRTQQIQQALIRSHYLDGEPSGAWDSKTQEALRRYQAANGWQNKVVPDSRALIKLGLGPSNDRLLNPETAMTSGSEATAAVSTPAASNSNSNPPRQ
jgi:hypothetical protein